MSVPYYFFLLGVFVLPFVLPVVPQPTPTPTFIPVSTPVPSSTPIGSLVDDWEFEQPSSDLDNVMKKVLKKEVVYPNKYNAEFEIIRYFKLMFQSSSKILDMGCIENNENLQQHAVYNIVLIDDENHYKEMVELLKQNASNLVLSVVNNELVVYEEL